jgi:hypothetical protein
MKRGFFLLIVVALLPILLIPGARDHPLRSFSILVGGVVALLLVIVVHELGHAVAGVAQGLRLKWLAVGPVMLELSGRRRLRPSPLGGAAAGFAAFDLDGLTLEQIIPRWRRMAAAGHWPTCSLPLWHSSWLGASAGCQRGS